MRRHIRALIGTALVVRYFSSVQHFAHAAVHRWRTGVNLSVAMVTPTISHAPTMISLPAPPMSATKAGAVGVCVMLSRCARSRMRLWGRPPIAGAVALALGTQLGAETFQGIGRTAENKEGESGSESAFVGLGVSQDP